MYIPKSYNGSLRQPMTKIIQLTRSVFRKKFKSVIRCFDLGNCGDEQILAVGSQDKHLYIINSALEILQAIKFPQWVRCIATGDLTNDGNSEIVVGCGDHTLRVFHSDGIGFHEIHSIAFNGFVTSCALADITGDGNLEIIAGSWDKTVRAYSLKNQEMTLLWQQEFEAGIQVLKTGDLTWDRKPEIVCLFKGNGMAVLEGVSGSEQWDFNTSSELKSCDIGILDYRGYPTLVVGGNDHNVYFFNHQGNLIQQTSFEDRITSLLINDITGNGRNELILGMGQKSIQTIDFTTGDIADSMVRWNQRIHGVLLTMKTTDFTRDGKTDLIVAGYDCAICGVQDFYFGEAYFDPIPPAPYFGGSESVHDGIPADTVDDVPFVDIVEPSALFCADNDVTQSSGVTESEPEDLQSAETTPISDHDTEIKGKSAIYLEEDQPKISSSTFYAPSLDPSTSGIASKPADVEKDHGSGNKFTEVSPSDPIQEPTRFLKKPIEESPIPNRDPHTSDALIQKAYQILTINKFFASKALLFLAFREGEIAEIEIAPLFEYFKSKMLLHYSRSSPRGYHFLSNQEQTPVPPKKTPEVARLTEDYTLKLAQLFLTTPVFSTKSALLQAIQDQIVDSNSLHQDKIFELSKSLGLIHYSRTAPRGYSLIGSQPEVSVESLSFTKKQGVDLTIQKSLETLFALTDYFPTKKDLFTALDQQVSPQSGMTVDSLFAICKSEGFIKYSRASPRGYYTQNK